MIERASLYKYLKINLRISWWIDCWGVGCGGGIKGGFGENASIPKQNTHFIPTDRCDVTYFRTLQQQQQQQQQCLVGVGGVSGDGGGATTAPEAPARLKLLAPRAAKISANSAPFTLTVSSPLYTYRPPPFNSIAPLPLPNPI